MLQDLKFVISAMKAEPSTTGDVQAAKRSIKRTLLFMLPSEAAQVGRILPVKLFTDELAREQPRLEAMIVSCALFMLLYSVSIVLDMYISLYRNDTYWVSWRLWWGYSNRRLLRQSTDWHARHSTGEKGSIVGRNIGRFSNLFDEFLFGTLPAAARVVLTIAVLMFVNWLYALLLIVGCFVYGVVAHISEKQSEVLRKEFQERMKEVEDYGTEMIQNWRTIRALGMEEIISDRNEALLYRFWQDEWPRHRRYAELAVRRDLVIALFRALGYMLAGYMAIYRGESLGTVALVTMWYERAYSNVDKFSDLQRALNMGRAAFEDLIKFLRETPTVRSPEQPDVSQVGLGAMSLKDVTFSYHEDAEKKAICGLTLDIPAGSSVGFVGESGSGKSTLLSLLTREYDRLPGISPWMVLT